MQEYSLPFNREKIELSGYQLELVAELSAEPNSLDGSSIRPLSKAIYAAIILSVLFHGILVTIAFSYFNTPEQKDSLLGKAPKTIKIRYINRVISENDIEDSEKSTVADAIVKPKIKPIETAPEILKQDSDIGSTIDIKISPPKNIERELDPLIYDKNIEIYEPIPDALNDETTVFNPNFRRKIKDIQKEKFKHSTISGFMQRQKDNEYFEFKPTGGSQTVRINGNCFAVPEQNAFALSQSNWSILGNCENKNGQLNFEEPELKYRYNAKDK